eukprot:PhM_4_TR16895/c0_g1_i1/m.12036
MFIVSVAADLWGTKENLSFEFQTQPTLCDFLCRVEAAYDVKAAHCRPSTCPHVPFKITSVQLYDAARREWIDMCSSLQLVHNAQAFAFQPECPWHTDVQAPIPVPENSERYYRGDTDSAKMIVVKAPASSKSPPRAASSPHRASPPPPPPPPPPSPPASTSRRRSRSPPPVDSAPNLADSVYKTMSTRSPRGSVTNADLKAWLLCLGLDPEGDWTGTIFDGPDKAELSRAAFNDFARRYPNIIHYLHMHCDDILEKVDAAAESSAHDQRGYVMHSQHVSPRRTALNGGGGYGPGRTSDSPARRGSQQQLATERLARGLSSHAKSAEIMNPSKVSAVIRRQNSPGASPRGTPRTNSRSRIAR